MKKRIGVCLSGCGVMDGSEIHEAVLTLLAIERAGAEAVWMAPDGDQMHVVDHLKGEPVAGARRNVLVESARIARGEIQNLKDVKADGIDALVFPGGYGAAKNLCTFAVDGPDCQVDPEVERLINEMSEAGKPMGFLCIAPAIAAKVLGDKKILLTIGKDSDTASALGRMGAEHRECEANDCVVDWANKVVSTPAYMLAKGPAEMIDGIEKLIHRVLDLAR
jgi:enhancing lycopene biosynthesis protein 2